MIQDIAPKKMDITYKTDKKIEADSVCIRIKNQTILVHKADQKLPKYRDFSEEINWIYLFEIAGTDYYLTEMENVDDNLFEEVNLFTYQKNTEKVDAFAIMTAYHLSNWYRKNQYCGCCAHPTVLSDKERALVCPECGNTIYPRINPAIIVGVTKGNQLLLTRYRGRSYKGYALIAGFTEIGETVEDTVRREVMEEVGVAIKNIHYYKSQPWGQSGDILMGFFAEAADDAEIRMDKAELAEAAWHEREEIEFEDEGRSLTGEMITAFMKGLQ